MLQGTRTRRRRIPPVPAPRAAEHLPGRRWCSAWSPPCCRRSGRPRFRSPLPLVAPEPPPAPPPVQVQLVAPAPVVPRAALLNKLADSHTVALTFDDGPDPRWTPKILEILQAPRRRRHVLHGEPNAAGQEALVRQVVDAGMRLCDHSRTHDEQLPDRDPERIDDEVVGAETTLSAAAAGAPVEWFRAPGGNWSTEVAELSAEHGMQPLSWNVDPRDWERPGADAIVAAVQQQIRPAGARRPDRAAARRRRLRATRRWRRWRS